MVLKFFLLLLISANSYASELKIITPESFLKEDHSLERKEIVEFLINQFNGKKISQADLDKLWNNKKLRKKQQIIRFQIINQELYADTYSINSQHFMRWFRYLQKFIKNYKVKDVDFIIYDVDRINYDSSIEDALLNIPVFMMSKNLDDLYERDKFLIPDAHMIIKAWQELTKNIAVANLNNSWDKKYNKIFWRGATTGSMGKYYYDIDNFDKLVRIKLVMLSKLYPDLIDARFTYYPEFSNGNGGKKLKKLLKLLFPDEVGMIPAEDHLKYKYLISVDGSTCAWSRVPWIMYSNSVLMKQESKNIEWFYSALKPYVHYVPVSERLTDIFGQLEWMKKHDEELQKISQNAHNFVSNNLMPEHIEAHIAIILNEYANIQQDSVIKPTLVPEADMFPMGRLLVELFNALKNKLIERVNSWF